MRRLVRLGLGVLALALATAGCGGSSGAGAEVASAGGGRGAEAEDASTTPADAEQAGLDFARCMREHGVDMPDPKAGGDGFIMVGPSAGGDRPEPGGAARLPEAFAEADEACRHHLDDLIQEGGPPMDAEAQDRALKFARCMREHGVDMPDPDFSSGGGVRIEIGKGEAGGIDPSSETFRDAQEACGSLFGPDGGPGGPGGPGRPGRGEVGIASSGVRS